jgi:serine/threonine protein kinase
MNGKENPKNPSPEDEWLKTLSDSPVSEIEKRSKAAFQSPYTIVPKPDGKTGETLGSGTIVSFLGEGGMARVYKIWNEAFEMHRSVKVLVPTGKKEVSDRFITEARITARLNHPNIVSVFGFGEWKGCPFIEMEFIDGVSLDDLLKSRGPFPAYVACAIGVFIAKALSYAHMLDFTLLGKQYRGVIHRDLKPGNIMLHNDGRLKLMDFGIARPISTGLHTMVGNIVGTLPYLSPEQLNHENIDQRTDIYAVGAILYELLCGVKAFPDESLTDLVNKKASGTYIHFGDFPVSVPAKLTEIVDTCLQVKKEDRYPNADALAEALNIAYEQCTCERPESALKGFLDDPHHAPILEIHPKKGKKGIRLPRPQLPRFQLPSLSRLHFPRIRLPRPHFPRIQLPRFPRIRLPRLPRPHFPRIQLPRLPNIAHFFHLVHLPRKQRSLWIAGSIAAIALLVISGILIFYNEDNSFIRMVREWFVVPEQTTVANNPASNPLTNVAVPAVTDTLNKATVPTDTAVNSGAASVDSSKQSLKSATVDTTQKNPKTPEQKLSGKQEEPAPVISPETTATPPPLAPPPISPPMPPESLDVSMKMCTIAENAITQGNLDEAFDAIGKINNKYPKKVPLQIKFVEICLKKNELKRAHYCAFLIQSDDARVHILKGRFWYAANYLENALTEYETAQNSPMEIGDKQETKKDILYYQSECRETMYRRNPIRKNYDAAIRSWNKVKDSYMKTPLHPRHSLADYRLRQLEKDKAKISGAKTSTQFK